MQTLIRKSGAERYLAKDGTWTDDPRGARMFSTALSARTYRACHHLSETQLLPAVSEADARLVAPNRGFLQPAIAKVSNRIEAQVELGNGHAIFIRGEGAGLSWKHGTRLMRVEDTTWVWCPKDLNNSIVFALLLDDQIWAKGEQLRLAPGDHLKLQPDFEWPEIPRVS